MPLVMLRYVLKTAISTMFNTLFIVHFYRAMHFSAKRGIAIACRLSVRLSVRPSVCLSVTFVDQDHIGWKSWKLIARTISPTPSLFVAPKDIHLFRGEHGEIWGRVEVGWVNDVL